ncbi:NADH-quinone oxidoreductase subunit A [Buchnera aphidicola]|uniref:NADH-quinone oxidoreductase subunit A n=1 Tax=Buchnera aphidicola TaxID=9 RepID=UPI003463937D
MCDQNYSFLFFICFSFFVCFIMLLGGWLLGSRSISRNKHTPFESGIDSFGNTNLKLSIKFYLIAAFFVIFDVESLYLYAWSINITKIGWCGFLEVLTFVGVLLLSIIYLTLNGVFDWVSNKSTIHY